MLEFNAGTREKVWPDMPAEIGRPLLVDRSSFDQMPFLPPPMTDMSTSGS